MNLNQKQNEDYISMINYLINKLNKAKISSSSLNINQKLNMPIFLYEFFVYELYAPKEILKFLKQPLLCFRLLDFPTLTLEGFVDANTEKIVFNQGKSSFFEMEMNELKDKLINQPLYIMFLDLNYGNINVIANCRLNISLFSYDTFLNYDINSKGPEPRKNILQLFDNRMEKVAEFEMALLIKREYYKFDKNIEITEEKKTSYLIKKAKKSKDPIKNYKESKSNFFCIEGKEKPKNEIYKGDIKFGVKEDVNIRKVPQPQYVNNFILEGKDEAFNAHPVNKVIILGQRKKNQDDLLNNQKEKKTKDLEVQTDHIKGLNVPINLFDYNKKEKPKKIKRKPNNKELINSMLNKNKNQNQYNFQKSHYKNFNKSNRSNFNNNQKNNYINNNQNISNDMLFYQTNGIYDNTNRTNQNNYLPFNNINSGNENIPLKSESNEYLKFIMGIKSNLGAN